MSDNDKERSDAAEEVEEEEEEEEQERPLPPPKTKTPRPDVYLGLALAVAVSVLLLFVYRDTSGSARTTDVPVGDPKLPMRECPVADRKCVVEMGRAYAALLRKQDNKVVAEIIDRSVAALERDDCDTALKTESSIRDQGQDPNMIEGLIFTRELTQSCLGQPRAMLDDAGILDTLLQGHDGGGTLEQEDMEEMLDSGLLRKLLELADGGSLPR